MLATHSLTAHLARGVVGIALLVGAYLTRSSNPLFAIGFAACGLVALRGCPMCWTLGLIELSHQKECSRCSK